MTQKPSSHALERWLPVGIWMGVIFAFSSIPSLESGLLPIWDLVVRKLAHMVEYAILAVLVLRAFSGSPRTALWKTIALGVLYALTDELHQSFVSGRAAAISDVLIDGLGVLIGLGVWELTRLRKNTNLSSRA